MLEENQHKEKPNWLLYFLIAVSIFIHAGILFQATGRFHFKRESYIEIGVRKNLKPQARAIPWPRKRPAADKFQDHPSRIVPDYTVPFSDPVPDETEKQYPAESAPKAALSPEKIPQDTPMDIAEFSLPAVEETGGFGSGMDYLDMVRLKIESRKHYPPFSRQRNIEGLVTVAFLIGPDGKVSGLTVVKSSGFSSLDEAAIAAVNNASPFSPPPEKYFKQQVRVKVPIAFELIK